ncbi:hypothetical protein K6V78_02170 [Streptococcus gallolyticus]|nr:hypothetical protein [Streptococcus gallolyticus]MBY5040445.1 hypothetical protein [Streptococcus gallolyticus]
MLKTVTIGKKIYQLSQKEAQGLLQIASDNVQFGIYAVEKDNKLDMLNLRLPSKTALKRQVRSFKAQGFKVYCNGL